MLRAWTTNLANGGPSRLEVSAVNLTTLRDYERRLNEFADFCKREGLQVLDVCSLELAMLTFFDQAYLAGRALDVGTKLVAAVGARWPALHRSGQVGLLPRARRALQGWARLDPPTSRHPLPWPVLELLATFLVAWLRRDEALAIL